jgi:thioredoxin 1
MTKENVHEVNELNFEVLVEKATGASLVDFTAAWCPPCRALSPIVARVAAETAGRVSVATVDADANPALAARFRIRGLPTLIVFRDGREIARRTGLTDANGVRALLRPALTPESPRIESGQSSLSATRA